MKVKVIKTFRDKHDHKTEYGKGTILEVQDGERARSLIDRGLAKEFKGNQKAAVTLSEPCPEKPEPEDAGEGGEDSEQ